MEVHLRAEKEKYAPDARPTLGRTFGDLAANRVRANNQSFLEPRQLELGGQTRDAKNTLEAKEQATQDDA